MSLFRSLGERVRQGLRRTRDLMDEGLGAILSIARPVDEAMLEELEETLIAADLGAALNQTGLKKKDINGLSITTQASPDTAPHVAEQLGFELDWVLNADYGGASGVGVLCAR